MNGPLQLSIFPTESHLDCFHCFGITKKGVIGTVYYLSWLLYVFFIKRHIFRDRAVVQQVQ